MEMIFKVLIMSHLIFNCDGIGIWEQLEHIAKRKKGGRGFNDVSRRFDVDPSRTSVILGAPSMASHLPEAEPILPGHTLIKPARGMLKSAVKFPHRDLDDGAGVYGNVNNLGIRYGGKQDRVMYTGFRRMPSLEYFVKPQWDALEYEENHMDLSPNKRHDMRNNDLVIVLTSSDIINSLFQLYGSRLNKIGFVKNRNEYRKKKHQANYVLKLLKNFQHYNKGKTVRENIMRRVLTPLGLIVMETPDEEAAEVTETSYENSLSKELDDKPREKSNEKVEKKKWFWNTKDTFNHIKINPDAPELSDFMPKNLEDKTNDWSYYNQESSVD